LQQNRLPKKKLPLTNLIGHKEKNHGIVSRKPINLLTLICKKMKKSVNLAEFNAAGNRLSIFMNPDQEPLGVLIPLAGWANIATGVAKDCELYLLMSQLTFKPVFERSLKEQGQLLDPVIEQVKEANLKHGLYNSYRDKHCTSKDLFIHEYQDRTELVRVNAATGQTTTIKQLSR
jgi:hypothetical protein